MYDRDEMTTLHSAADCKSTAEQAPYNQQLAAVAYLINNAANCGDTIVTCQQRLLPEVKAQLLSNGYVIENAGVATKDLPIRISWSGTQSQDDADDEQP